MAGYWLKLDEDLNAKPEFAFIVAESGLDPQLVEGRIVSLWRWVSKVAKASETHPGCGELRPCSLKTLAHQCGGDAAFWRTVATAGWIEIDADGLCVRIPGFEQRFGDIEQRRQRDAERKRTKRAEAKAAQPIENTPAVPASVPAAVETDGPWQPNGDSSFDELTESTLKDRLKLLRWAVRVAHRERSNPNKLGEHEEMFYIRVIAAAQHATASDVRVPLALFRSLLGSKGRNRLQIDKRCMREATTYIRKLREEIRSKPESIKKMPNEDQLTLQFINNL